MTAIVIVVAETVSRVAEDTTMCAAVETTTVLVDTVITRVEKSRWRL